MYTCTYMCIYHPVYSTIYGIYTHMYIYRSEYCTYTDMCICSSGYCICTNTVYAYVRIYTRIYAYIVVYTAHTTGYGGSAGNTADTRYWVVMLAGYGICTNMYVHIRVLYVYTAYTDIAYVHIHPQICTKLGVILSMQICRFIDDSSYIAYKRGVKYGAYLVHNVH